MRRLLHPSAVPSLVALAAAALFSGPAGAVITWSGDVSPNPAGGTVAGRLDVGTTAAGQVEVAGGSLLALQQLRLGDRVTGSGALVVTGVGSKVTVDGLNVSGLGIFDFGGWGTGAMSVLDGASFEHGVNTTACLSGGCHTVIGNAAGSNGSLLVSGAGSIYTTLGTTTVGLGTVRSTAAGDAFNYGTPGAATQATVRVQAGATLRSAQMTVAAAGAGNGRTGAEAATGSLIVEGAGTLMAMTRASTTTGDQSLLSIANGRNATGTAEVRNGAKLTLDGSAAPTVFTGINIGTGGSGAQGTLIIDGAGSLVQLSGGQGFINVGANNADSFGVLQITGGGRIAGVGETGLAFTTVGRNGATGTLTVSGTDAAGNASTFRLAGRNPVTDGGAFLNIGGQSGSNQTGTGTANILAGGRVEVDTTGVVTNTPTARPGTYIGVGAGAVGSLTISGKSASGAASTLAISGGTGVTPFIGIGRDGGIGSVTVSNGGRWLITSNHVSTSTNNANGDIVQLMVGSRDSTSNNLGNGASVGTLTVTGIGSEVALTGVADRYILVAAGEGATGTLNITQGGVARALAMLVGNTAGGTGTLNVDGGRIELEGKATAGPTAGQGGGLVVGRNGGTATANFSNGAVLQVSSTAESPGVNLGGSISGLGGTGTINVLSGSQINVTGPSAVLRVGTNSSTTAAGIGTLNLADAGSSVQLVGNGARALIGATNGTQGTVNIGAGTTLSAGSLLGIAHNGTGDTGGTGLLVVNGVASADSIINGTAGVISGSGTLVGNVINHGTINPGNSPGTLTIDGSFTNAAGGTLVLEIASDGAGGFVTDRLLFTNGSGLDLTGSSVQFSFLGAADPNAFLDGGLFGTSTFFQQYDTQGQLNGFAASTFTGVQFSATSQAYTISNFSFDAATGAQFTAAAVPEPATWALWLAGALALGGLARRRRAVGV